MKTIIFLLTINLLISCGSGDDDTSINAKPPVPGIDTPTITPPPPPPPVELLEVEIGDSGDRFYPVEVEITYQIDDVAQPYEYELTMGHAQETQEGLLIYGDGRVGDGILTVNDEEYQFTIIEEPTCDVSDAQHGLGIDCAGYLHRIPSNGPFIYYGEADTTVVEWEMVYLHWDSKCAGYQEDSVGDLKNKIGPCDPDDWLPNEREQIVKVIDEMNKMYERAGVYVKLVPVRIQKGYFTTSAEWKPDIGHDLVLWADGAMTNSGNGVICGYAGYSGLFNTPLQPYSACGIGTHLHEIGHTVGLSHGPNNPINASDGLTFPHFGHGRYSVCPAHDSIMSYGTKTIVSTESRTCAEASPNGTGGDQIAGLRGPYGYDEAYAINRIRYNVALINHNNGIEFDIVTELLEDTQEIIDIYPRKDALKMINQYLTNFGVDILDNSENLK
ncbi:MAG: hypothetical protein GY886_10430 [Gammaproteobacteria bacterium]|nr:hypothetical protein [Gammaproteobacteria bacterium]